MFVDTKSHTGTALPHYTTHPEHDNIVRWTCLLWHPIQSPYAIFPLHQTTTFLHMSDKPHTRRAHALSVLAPTPDATLAPVQVAPAPTASQPKQIRKGEPGSCGKVCLYLNLLTNYLTDWCYYACRAGKKLCLHHLSIHPFTNHLHHFSLHHLFHLHLLLLHKHCIHKLQCISQASCKAFNHPHLLYHLSHTHTMGNLQVPIKCSLLVHMFWTRCHCTLHLLFWWPWGMRSTWSSATAKCSHPSRVSTKSLRQWFWAWGIWKQWASWQHHIPWGWMWCGTRSQLYN